MRLIDADELKTAMDEGTYADRYKFSTGYAKSFINNAPTVDAVPVVRCKDCKWFGLAGCAIQIVDDIDKPSEDDFCSFGERKGADE